MLLNCQQQTKRQSTILCVDYVNICQSAKLFLLIAYFFPLLMQTFTESRKPVPYHLSLSDPRLRCSCLHGNWRVVSLYDVTMDEINLIKPFICRLSLYK